MKNPFGDDAPLPPRYRNPFGDGPDDAPEDDPASRIEHMGARIRRLKALVGADGLPPSATRELLDHIAVALEAAARAIRERE